MSSKIIQAFISLLIIMFIGFVNCADTYKHPGPVNPKATKEAKALLDFLYQISGKYILSGHHNYTHLPARYNEEVKQMTGHYPVVWGSDFGFYFRGKDPDSVRQGMIDKAIEMHQKGHIITLMWHCCYPTDGDSCGRESIWVMENKVPQPEWDSLTTPGTELDNQWRTQADNVAKYLKQLQEAHIPVLWRPYHEMNGVWFWWCQHPGEQGFVKLWKMMYDYFTNHHQLNNLLWVWNANAPRSIPRDEAYAYKDYFPGIEYVDVLASDVYHNDYKQSHHDELLELAQGKPIALGEIGQMPTPEIINEQPQWTWFMGWADFLHKVNNPDSVRALYTVGSYEVQLNTFADSRFKKGVNLTGWFQGNGPKQIQFTKFTKNDLKNIKSLGCNVIRLPINLHFMTNGAPNYILDNLFLSYLDQVVDWAEDLGINLILDNHSFDPSVSTSLKIKDVLIPVWTQLADHYKDRSNFIYYEILNEPHGISDSLWNNIQGQVIDAIREVDKKHTIIVGPANWNSFHNLQYMPVYKDTNLIYTFHFYDPFLFTHQGATWVNPSMSPVKNVPFPYDVSRMPRCPEKLFNTWVEDLFNNYKNDGTVQHIQDMLDIAIDFQKERNVPIYCGELGAYMKNSSNDDRVYWYRVVRDYLEQNGIPWTMWDYYGGFGLFKNGSNDLNIPLLKALGFKNPQLK